MSVTSVDDFIHQNPDWSGVLTLLRDLLLETELSESIKWNFPVYTLDGKNVAGLGAFKSYAGIWFFQGSFLRDPLRALINAQEGKTKGMRQWRFTSREEAENSAPSIREYIREAIQNQKEGKEIKIERNKEVRVPEALMQVFSDTPEVKHAFQQLSIGKQRDYAEHISSAKRPETKITRLEKIIPMIKSGIGLNDKYKK